MTFTETIEAAAHFIRVAKAARTRLDAAVTPGGQGADLISVTLTKEQAIAIVAMIDETLESS